eukprot:CAMPEP_0202488918 /NCGR_PEP_ID=MMETSP1361-20130828/6818_1 /ASSEMBLY_ACC=CAM_ASM_000849 /TAXON_ID=210615 /ORGANISM="Staurosira complex sp., Strain CCMP2646" /LENGTH=286 /DNA_ID=CAMNT_0049118589 /DNA_START=111 /DNA_END=971 /DNA_ORIENTATION=+
MLFFACISFLLLLFPTASNALCLPIDLAPTLEQEFETASLVARLQLIQPPQDMELACGMEVFTENEIEVDSSPYVITNTLPAYEILEVFKGPSFPTTIPIVWFTDTGLRTVLPTSFTDNNSDGFLAFLTAIQTCQNETSFWVYEEDYEPIPYEMSECSYTNMPWSSVSDGDVEWLRQNAVVNDDDEASMAPSSTYSIGISPTVAPAPTATSIPDASLVPSSLNEEPSSSFSSSLVPTLQDTSFPSVGSETSNLDTETTSGGDAFAVSIMGSLAIMIVSTIASLVLY